jgi:hypothetical protein
MKPGKNYSATYLFNSGCLTRRPRKQSGSEPEWHNCAIRGWRKSHGTAADSTHKSQMKIGMLSNIFQVSKCREAFLKSIQIQETHDEHSETIHS